MAIGAAQVMGFNLMRNFDRPYHSKSIHEFWGRWHISLSSWFRDYLYISLGGNRVSIPRWYFNLFIVFLVSGLWHGASWTFVFWGALHGTYLVFALLTKNLRNTFASLIGLNKLPLFNNFLQIVVTFSLTTFAWIFFRANSLSVAFYIIKNSFNSLYSNLSNLLHHEGPRLELGLARSEILIGIGAIILMEVVHIMQDRYSIRDWIRSKPAYIRWCIYYALIIIIIFFGVYQNRQFIYFQF